VRPPAVRLLLISAAVLMIAIVASAVAWWRWERIELAAGDVPLPPGAEVVRLVLPQHDGGAGTVVARSRRGPERLREFYRSEMEARGWRCEEVDGRLRFRKGKRIVRLVSHPQKRFTTFTLNISPFEKQ
jgi:hypothetical protein